MRFFEGCFVASADVLASIACWADAVVMAVVLSTWLVVVEAIAVEAGKVVEALNSAEDAAALVLVEVERIDDAKDV